jgi:hypothetical protein
MHEEMINILIHKGNTNQNDIEDPSHPIQRGYPRENKTNKWH